MSTSKSLSSIAGAAVVLAAMITPSLSVAAERAPRPPAAAKRSPKVLPTGLAKRGTTRAARRAGSARPAARAASVASYDIKPTECGNTFMTITQPRMQGHGNDANWVSVQHGVFKNVNGFWQLQAWGAPGYARAYYTRVSPGAAWVLQNGTPLPSQVDQYALWGWGQYRMAHYLQWYDGANRVALTASVWSQHFNWGNLGELCDLQAYGEINTVNYG